MDFGIGKHALKESFYVCRLYFDKQTWNKSRDLFIRLWSAVFETGLLADEVITRVTQS